MHASKQTDQYRVTARCSGGSGDDDEDGHSRRQEFFTGKGVPREHCKHPENTRGRTDVGLAVSGRADMAVCCILSALLWWTGQFEGGVNGGGKQRKES